MTFQPVGMRHSIPGKDRLKGQGPCAPLLPPLPVPSFIEDLHSELTEVGEFYEVQSRGMWISTGPGRS